MNDLDPYDELPYHSLPIEWTAPERLALASLLHGGPRPPLDRYRVLELGCGDGANLLPLAYYRGHARFVGVDRAAGAVTLAERRARELGLDNVEVVHTDFCDAAARLSGRFDFIVAHGVVSWVSDEVRDGLMALCAERLAPDGLFYFNYNARPGWNVRGMVRDFLRTQTAETRGLSRRAALAQELASRAAALTAGEHPYSRLIEREFRFVCESHPSYVAHEFLAADNRAYWRSEMLALARTHGFVYVADADFNHESGRVGEGLREQLAAAGLTGGSPEDTADVLSYRQLHSPIMTRGSWSPAPPGALADLVVASSLVPVDDGAPGPRIYRHANGFEVEVREPLLCEALDRLLSQWPRGARIGALFRDAGPVLDDLVLLYRHGLIALSASEPDDPPRPPERLHALQRRWGSWLTMPDHTSGPASE